MGTRYCFSAYLSVERVDQFHFASSGCETTVEPEQAVDRAAAGDCAIDFDIQGEGEVVQLANSVRNLVERMHQKE